MEEIVLEKKLTLTVPAYENLLAHLVNFEERRSKILNEYFPEYNQQREEFERLLNSYIKALDSVVKNVSLSDASSNDFPFVCINSEIQIEDIEESEVYNYKVISPETSYTSDDSLTFLSPMGRALLCKKEGDVISVDTPSGVYRYRIRSVRLY